MGGHLFGAPAIMFASIGFFLVVCVWFGFLGFWRASGAALASDPGGVSLPPPQNRLCPHFTNKAAMAKLNTRWREEPLTKHIKE
jgi:hypothetical protein